MEPDRFRCLVLHGCSLREWCVKADTLLTGNVQHFQPKHTGEHCEHFESRHSRWGDGKEIANHD